MNLSKIKFYLLILKIIFLAFILLNTYQAYSGNMPLMTVFWILTLLLAVNDILRKILASGSVFELLSLSLSIIGAAVLKYFVPGIGSTVYIFVPLFELFYLSVNKMKTLITLHAVSFFAVTLLFAIPFTTEKIAGMGTNVLLYLGVACMSYLLHSVQKEKEEVKKLNEELTVYNNRLMEYARQVEDLTIEAERSRVAQELHDSLGHSLMALSMNLDYAEKISDMRPGEVKKVIGKAKEISKKSVSDLRAAVHALREERPTKDLNDSMNELIGNLGRIIPVDIHFSMDNNLENTNPELKNCIYKTIREGLTNGLKHGKATVFDISVKLVGSLVQLNIADNGSGCEEIIESVGLRGIRERISALGGRVRYKALSGGGFQIMAEIPVSKEDS